jgi:FkbM family methyltransferase
MPMRNIPEPAVDSGSVCYRPARAGLDRGERRAAPAMENIGMHEITRRLDVDFILRSGTVDLPSLDWIIGSVFITSVWQAGLGPEDAVMDFGSHIGSFALPVVRRTGCRAWCFEPDEPSLRISRATAVLNGLDERTQFVGAGIGGRDGTVRLYQSDENWGHTIVEGGGPGNRLTGESTEVPILSLASAFALAGDARRVFVKVNIEGAEYEMFEQASLQTLQCAEWYVGEIHYDLGRADFKPCIARLQEAGFDVTMLPAGDVRALLVARRV